MKALTPSSRRINIRMGKKRGKCGIDHQGLDEEEGWRRLDHRRQCSGEGDKEDTIAVCGN